MMKRIINILFAACLVTMLGCGGWSYIKDSKSQDLKSYSFQLPKGWMKIKFGNDITLTRDATSLQAIRVSFDEKAKAFEKLKKELPENALPFELAELFLAEMKATNEGINIELVENAPITIAGKDGFRLHLKTKSRTGVAYQMLVTGFATKEGLYTLSYDAPSTRYFALDKENYETLVKSFAKKS